jgi:hypothetical protein
MIELHLSSGIPNAMGDPVYVNPERISFFHPRDNTGTRIYYGQAQLAVSETPGEILEKIRESNFSPEVRNCEKFKSFDKALRMFLEEFCLISNPDPDNQDRWDKLPEHLKDSFARWCFSSRLQILDLDEKGKKATMSPFSGRMKTT